MLKKLSPKRGINVYLSVIAQAIERLAPEGIGDKKTMPKFCKIKAASFSDNYITALVFEKSCDVLIAFLGMDPGSENDTGTPQYFGFKIFHFSPCGYQIAIYITTIIVAFILGVYVR